MALIPDPARRHTPGRVVCSFVLLVFACVAAATAHAAPPEVMSISVNDGDLAVDPGLTEIRIAFDQDMTIGGHSVTGGGPLFPELTGPPRWPDPRTCVIDVRLAPGRLYTFGLNAGAYTGFRSAAGEILPGRTLTFATRPASDTPAPDAEALRRAVRTLEDSLLTRYAYRDRLGIDWSARVAAARDELLASPSWVAFVVRLREVLSGAEDGHIWIDFDGGRLPTYQHDRAANINGRVLSRLVPNLRRINRTVSAGRFDDGVAYLWIASWSNNRQKDLEAALEVIESSADAPGMIIDVRMNGGGNEMLARRIASCFLDEPRVYAKHVFVDPEDPDGWGEVQERTVRPAATPPTFDGPVAVLTGPANLSSCEAFLLMMKAAPRAVLVGGRSGGSSGNPRPVELSPEVTVFLPSWRALRADGTCFEGEGIAPDVPVEAGVEAFRLGDPVLAAGLAAVRTGPPAAGDE